jgi:hypothetical protein
MPVPRPSTLPAGSPRLKAIVTRCFSGSMAHLARWRHGGTQQRPPAPARCRRPRRGPRLQLPGFFQWAGCRSAVPDFSVLSTRRMETMAKQQVSGAFSLVNFDLAGIITLGTFQLRYEPDTQICKMRGIFFELRGPAQRGAGAPRTESGANQRVPRFGRPGKR